LKKVTLLGDDEAGVFKQTGQAFLGVACDVLVQHIVIRPERLKRRHRRQKDPIGRKEPAGCLKGAGGMGKMFEHVEHQYQRVLLTRLERFVKWANVDTVPPRCLLPYGFLNLDTLYVSEFREALEEKPFSAANVQDRSPTACGLEAVKFPHDQFGSCPPPPVFLEEFAVMLAVFRVHCLDFA
jgi:hypothetical protein